MANLKSKINIVKSILTKHFEQINFIVIKTTDETTRQFIVWEKNNEVDLIAKNYTNIFIIQLYTFIKKSSQRHI